MDGTQFCMHLHSVDICGVIGGSLYAVHASLLLCLENLLENIDTVYHLICSLAMLNNFLWIFSF